jgi:ribonuclease P protein component
MALFDATRAVRDEACSAGRKSGRIAVIAGKRLGAAPRRNRAKRLIREAVRQSDARWPGYDVLLIARERLFDGGLMLVQSDIQRITARLHGGNTNEG